MHRNSSTLPDRDRLFAPWVGRTLGWLSLVSLGALALFGLWGAPEDATQKEAQRLMYLHVPAAWLAYLAFGVTALASALFLWPRTRSLVWDRIAGASAELGVVFTALTLVLGSLWGKPVWACGGHGTRALLPPRSSSSSTSATSHCDGFPVTGSRAESATRSPR